jgi:hypothetical protein
MGFRRVLSRAKTKRLPLTTKKAHKGYYKGNGARKEGRITSKGIDDNIFPLTSFLTFYIILGKFLRVRAMCTELIVPDLTDFPLKPYIGAGAKRNLTDVNVKV